MNKNCARCEKTVYPIEELKCLDKIWHKGCFKCQECGMTLNMKTYKGYGKLPYCEAHVPKAKHTTMAETPELKRIAENTKLQSNVNYHADFEKSKGKFTQVADDPETLRIKANTQHISNVAYHGELAKKAAMEKQRTLNENGELIELPTPDSYDIQIESYATDLLPPSIPPPSIPPPAPYQPPPKQQHYPAPADYNTSNQQYRNQTHKYDQGHQAYQTQAKYDHTQAKYDHTQAKYDQTQQPKYDQTQSKYDATHQSQIKYEQTHQPQKYDPNHQNKKYDPSHQTQKYHDVDYQTEQYQFNQYSAQPNVQISSYPTQPKSVYDEYSGRSRDMIQREQQHAGQVHAQGYQQQYSQQQQQQRIGKIEDYDPVVDGPRQQSYMPRPSATLIYNSSEQNNGRGHQSQPSGRRPIGSVSDMDPLAAETYRAPAPHAQHAQHAAPPPQRASPAAGKVYVAMYDYEANDSDEVSFREGDLISNVSSIDEGWMTGQVLRTGRTGMLPANYVELAPM